MEEEKIFKLKGKDLEELKQMSLKDLSKLLPSDFRRKVNRGFTEQENKFLLKIEKKEKNIKTHSRDMFVLPSMMGQKISIYNGKDFVQVFMVQEMIGLRLGELAPTRKIAKHTTIGGKKVEVRK